MENDFECHYCTTLLPRELLKDITDSVPEDEKGRYCANDRIYSCYTCYNKEQPNKGKFSIRYPEGAFYYKCEKCQRITYSRRKDIEEIDCVICGQKMEWISRYAAIKTETDAKMVWKVIQ